MCTGSCSVSPATRMTSGVIVAEKSRFWRLLGKQGQDALHVGPEAHVEHAVGLVEDEHLDVREVAVALAAQVEQAARGGDEHVDAAAKRLGLRLVADAAVDDGDAVLGELGGLAGDAVDLQRELAGGGDDQRARACCRRRCAGAAAARTRRSCRCRSARSRRRRLPATMAGMACAWMGVGAA